MVYEQLPVQSVQMNRPQIHRVDTSEGSPHTPTNLRIFDDDRHASLSSDASRETVVRWQTPPSRSRSPQAQAQLDSFETLRPDAQDIGVNEAAYASNTPLVVRFDEEQIRTAEAAAAASGRRTGKMDDDMDSYPPTPSVDDTPYIRFAIDQLTRDQEVRANTNSNSDSQRPSTNSSDYPVERIVPDMGLGYMTAEREREAMRLVRKHRSSPPPPRGRLFNYNATRPLSYPAIPEPVVPIKPTISEIFIPVDPPQATRYPDLTFVPVILRPLSMIALSLLCLLMSAAIIACAVYSNRNGGLVDWQAGGIHSGRYFVFGFLPQILAACIFIYVQGVMTAMTRILPYTMMANEDAEHRANALFLGIFPRSLLFPHWEGPLSFEIAHSVFWLSVFTIPLQSCLFSVVQVNGVWRWTTVQGIAWTLVGIYLLVLVASAIFGMFFFRRVTGLMWDPTSLADIIALLPRSNSTKDYPGTDLMKRKVEIKDRISVRSDRLGYWRTQNKNQGIFYCVGEHGTATRRYTLTRGQAEKQPDETLLAIDVATAVYNPQIRFRYIPWFLRDTFVILWAVAGFIFLLALFIISFLPSTTIRHGFRPSVTVLPDSSGFSAANFLYSFIPSIIGLLLYIWFLSLDMEIRKLQPWAELSSPNGAAASDSLLLDYTSLPPIACTLSALRHGHYRVAILSLSSFLFILLPILSGGLFFPLTTSSEEVKILPNLPSFYIILILLTIYLLSLVTLLPNRRTMHLPHAVDCLAEIFSFAYGSGMLQDAPFRAPKTKEDLVTRLSAVRARGEVHRYAFGVYRAPGGDEVLGIDRMGRRGNEVLISDPKGRI